MPRQWPRAIHTVLTSALALAIAAGALLAAPPAYAKPAGDAPPTIAADALDPAALRRAGANELGAIPVLMYHIFTTDRSIDDLWTRHVDDFRSDLQWLYDHDFYVISVRSLLDNTFEVPAGKHPVVLTFDDSSPRQFQFERNGQGELVPTSDSAVGVMEAFFAAHPDFGKSGHFAVVPTSCFAVKDKPDNTWAESCGPKLQWLSDHGYEVGNHTWSHQNLYLIGGDQVAEEVGQAAEFIDRHVTGPGNLSRVLTLPYGDQPAPGTAGASHLANGFWWNGRQWAIEARLRVSGGPMYTPSSSWWDPMAITRFNTDGQSLDTWFGAFARGEVILYTSDGNPATVAIPAPLPAYLQNECDRDLIAQSGKRLVEYPATDGRAPDAPAGLAVDTVAYTNDWGVRLRVAPSTAGAVVTELPANEAVAVVGGPVDADGHVWWEVVLADGTRGWVAGTYLANDARI